MFELAPEQARRSAGNSLSFFVEGIDALHDRQARRGARIIDPLEAKPWGLREYTVLDLNGYRLRFGEAGGRDPDAPRGAHPEALRVVDRRPTIEEYNRLLHAVGWADATTGDAVPLALANALHGAVAMVGGEAVGTALVVGDGATFFYVKDVMVLPEYQGRGVGTALMESLVAYLRRAAPARALVGLFTARGLAPFYERFGFRGPDHALHGMTLRVRDLAPTPA
jgi:GNAT superfamily N-acetyltransferase